MNKKLDNWGYVSVQVAEDITSGQVYDASVMRQQVETVVKDRNRDKYCQIRRTWGKDSYDVHCSPQMSEEEFSSLLADVEGSQILDKLSVRDPKQTGT